MIRRPRVTLLLALVVVMMAGCGGNNAASAPTTGGESQIADSVQQTIAAIAVAQTVAALTESGTPPPAPEGPPTATPPALPTDTAAAAATDPPPPTDQPPPPTATIAPTAAGAATCTVVSTVNLRRGPGTVYDPPVASAGTGTALQPIAYTPFGFPQGAWLQATVVSTGQTVWVSASPQFVNCTIDPATLPRPGNIPPTPQPPATNTPPPPTSQPVAALPPDLRNVSSGATCRDDPLIDAKEPIVNPRFLLRIDAQLFDPPPGESGNGAGIDRVEFAIFDLGFSHTERTAGYCIFQGGEPDCRDWPRNALGQLTWGNGGRVVEDGDYNISVTIYPKEETGVLECQWNVSLTIDVP